MPRSCKLWTFDPKLMKRMSVFTSRFIVNPGCFIIELSVQFLARADIICDIRELFIPVKFPWLEGSSLTDSIGICILPIISQYLFFSCTIAFRSACTNQPINISFDHHKYNQAWQVRGAESYSCKCSGGVQGFTPRFN